MFFNRYDKFDISTGKPVKVQITSSPHDTLDEFTKFEMGLKWFCHDYNHHILLEVGERIDDELLLFPHFLASLETGFVKYITEPTPEEIQYVGFDLIGFSFTYKKDKISFGLKGKKYQVSSSKCLKKLRNFVDGIFNTAIKKGYFKAEDAQKNLGWKPQSNKTLELEKFF